MSLRHLSSLIPGLLLFFPITIAQEPVRGGALVLSSITCDMNVGVPQKCALRPGKTLDNLAQEFYNLVLTEAGKCEPDDGPDPNLE